jgi:hypothetical protein
MTSISIEIPAIRPKNTQKIQEDKMTMRKLLDIGFVTLACIAMAACTSDEPVSTSQGREWKGGATAYLKVNINSASDATRGEDGGKSDGVVTHNNGFTCNEGKICNARFFFYDALGDFVTEGTLSDTLTGSKPDGQDNIEFQSDRVVILEGIDFCPTYVVTVLNTRTDWDAPAKLDQFYTLKISDISGTLPAKTWAKSSTSDENEILFPMMTSTYQNDENYPFVTRINADNYKNTLDATETVDPLDIYVERLQSKVTLNNDIEATPEVYTFNNNLIHLEGSMTSGSNNDIICNAYPLDSSYTLIETYTDDNGDTQLGWDSDVLLYAALIGWDVTATTNDSYMMKQIDSAWDQSTLGFSWTNSFSYRTFWGKSYNYGNASAVYPDHYTTGMTPELTYNSFASTNKIVSCNYFYNDTQNINTDGNLSYNPSEYAFENTNTSAVLSKHYPTAMSAALIKAKLLVKKDGVLQPMDLIRYDDQFFTTDAYIQLVYNYLSAYLQLRYYWHDSTTDVDLAPSDLQISDADYLNGRIVVTVKPRLSLNDESGTWLDYRNQPVTEAEINAQLAKFNANSDAIGYRDGDMYYYIPIEHLNNAANTINEYNQVTAVPEGKYGLVRNHWYQLSITDITAPGTGVWEPEEPIVPNPETILYSLSARLHVLAWKIVKQDAYL